MSTRRGSRAAIGEEGHDKIREHIGVHLQDKLEQVKSPELTQATPPTAWHWSLRQKLRLLLILIALVPGLTLATLDQIIPEHKRRHNPKSIGAVRLFDLFDPLFIVPFMSTVLKMVDGVVFSAHRPRRWYDQILKWSNHFLFAGYIYGSAVHFVSNAMNVWVTELNDYRDTLPKGLYEMIYFFDEDLGHWLSFLCLFLHIAILEIACEIPSDSSEWKTILSSVLMGLIWSVGASCASTTARASHLSHGLFSVIVCSLFIMLCVSQV